MSDMNELLEFLDGEIEIEIGLAKKPRTHAVIKEVCKENIATFHQLKQIVEQHFEKPKVTNQCHYCEAKLIPTIKKWGEQFEPSDLSSFNCPKCGARMKIQELSVEVEDGD